MARELPERVAFPLFEVGTSLVKEELQNRINTYIISILWKFECDLKVRAQYICENFQEIAAFYDKQLDSAEAVVEMETYKNNLQLDMSSLQRNLASTRKCLFFLMCQSDYEDILQEQSAESGGEDGECKRYVDQMLAWPNRLNEHCELADERHLSERAIVEKMVYRKKINFDQKVKDLREKLQQVHGWTRLDNYKVCMPTVQTFHS